MSRKAFDYVFEEYVELVKDFCNRFPSKKLVFSEDDSLSLVGHPTDWRFEGSTMCKEITFIPDSSEYIIETLYDGDIVEGDLRYETPFNTEQLNFAIEQYIDRFNQYEKYVDKFYKRFPSGVIYDPLMVSEEDIWDYHSVNLNNGKQTVICKKDDGETVEVILTEAIISQLCDEIKDKLDKYGEVPPQK